MKMIVALLVLVLMAAATVWAFGTGDCCQGTLGCYDKTALDCIPNFTPVAASLCEPTPAIPGSFVLTGVCGTPGPTFTPTPGANDCCNCAFLGCQAPTAGSCGICAVVANAACVGQVPPNTPGACETFTAGPSPTSTPTPGLGDCCQTALGCYDKGAPPCTPGFTQVTSAVCQPTPDISGSFVLTGDCGTPIPTQTPVPTSTPPTNLCCDCALGAGACFDAQFNCLTCTSVPNAVCLPVATPGEFSNPGACATLSPTPTSTPYTPTPTLTITPTPSYTLTATFTPTAAPTCPAVCTIDGQVFRANGAVDANDTITIYSALTKPTTLAGCVVNPQPPITTTTNASGVIRTFKVPYGMPVSITFANGGGSPVQTYVPYASTATMADFLVQSNVGRNNGFSGLAPPDQPVTFNNQAITNVQSLTLAPLHCWELVPPAGKTLAFCTDCTATTPCACGGTGALASYNGSAWNCAAAP